MTEIILDYSANTHKNDLYKIQEMINSVSEIDTKKHSIVFKSQLFKSAGDNIPCAQESFNFMYNRCEELGYKATASVFDKDSLDFLLTYKDIPFIKIANNRKLDYLIGQIPRIIPVYISYDSSTIRGLEKDKIFNKTDVRMHCISEYPAAISDYKCSSGEAISDHTIGLKLFKMYKPSIWEKHIIMPGDEGLDSGPFSITPEELQEIL